MWRRRHCTNPPFSTFAFSVSCLSYSLRLSGNPLRFACRTLILSRIICRSPLFLSGFVWPHQWAQAFRSFDPHHLQRRIHLVMRLQPRHRLFDLAPHLILDRSILARPVPPRLRLAARGLSSSASPSAATPLVCFNRRNFGHQLHCPNDRFLRCHRCLELGHVSRDCLVPRPVPLELTNTPPVRRTSQVLQCQ
jgi:hypothetical protein